uniref:Uncharacterized protein n=1 Tax=Terrapene triunguis TaxID=2587831 RepID=A0A674J639_9SAUR
IHLVDGRHERVMFDKITSRIQKLCYGLNADFVDPFRTLVFVTLRFHYNLILSEICVWLSLPQTWFEVIMFLVLGSSLPFHLEYLASLH